MKSASMVPGLGRGGVQSGEEVERRGLKEALE